MGKVVTLRLKDDQVERLERAARRLGRSSSSAAAVLLEEALRQRDFPFIEFRDSPVGRQAYLQGHRLAAWQVKWLISDYDGNVDAMAQALDVPAVRLSAALRYAEAYPDEIEAAIADNRRIAEDPQRYIPGVELVNADAPPS